MKNLPETSTTLLRDLAQDSQHARWSELAEDATLEYFQDLAKNRLARIGK